MKQEMVKEEKLKYFYNFLDTTSLLPIDKKNIKFLVDYFRGEIPKKFASRSCLISGDPGVGKTFLVEEFLNLFNVPILYTGHADIKKDNLVEFKDINLLAKAIQKYENYIIFIDDLNHVLEFNEYGEMSHKHKQALMKIFEKVKRSNKEIILIITDNYKPNLDEAMLDRIELKIEIDAPSESNKLDFLRKTYSNLLKNKEIKYIARNCIGYNFRDLPEVVKIAFREGDKKVNTSSLAKALKYYKPTSMSMFEVINNINLRFNDVIGKEKIKRVVNRVLLSVKRKDVCSKLGLKRSNLLIFHGSQGTGKTYFANALAGELGFPIIKVNALTFSRHGYFGSMYRLSKLAHRFKNSILFIDEADKLLARGTFDEDSTPQSYLNEIFDGIEDSVDNLVILSLNDLHRFGRALLDRFYCIKFENPNFKERFKFLNKKIDNCNVSLNIDITNAARITENMSFRDIEKVWNELMFHVLENKKVNEDLVRSTVKEIKGDDSNYNIFY